MVKQLVVLFTTLVWWCNIHASCMLSNETDRLALVAFKGAIDQDPLGVLSSWNDSVHYCDWKGILCGHRHHDRVVELNLTSQRLVGSLSPHIGNLSFLERVVLQDNSFHGPIPQEIGRLSRLRMIELSNNSFDGGIPNNLSRCSNLEDLNLNNNNLTGRIPVELYSLSKLRTLALSVNKLSGTIPPTIGNMSSLYKISLLGCNLWGEIPEQIVRLGALGFINLSQNNLSGKVPSGLYNISTIFILVLSINKLEGSIPPNIGSTLPNLNILLLFHNLFTGRIPISLSNASKLEQIDFGSNDFIGPVTKDLGEILGLQQVFFDSNQLQDDLSFISSLTNCTVLQTIVAAENFLRGTLPDSVANLSIHLSYFSLGENQLHGHIPSGIENLLELTAFRFAMNYLTGPIPIAIGRLHKLQHLDLSMNKLSELPSSLGNLTLLNYLYLGQNNIHGSIPPSLGKCHNLLALDLSHNNLSGLIPLDIMNLSSISISLSLAQNSLTGSLPSEVGSLKSLGELDVSNNHLSGWIPSSLGSCLTLERLYLESNSFGGELPQSLSELRGLRDLDLSCNNLSGSIPSYLGELHLENLNLSFNVLQGEVPTKGVFRNGSAISVVGNKNLCGGIAELNLPPCSSSKSNKNKLSHKMKVIISVVLSLAMSFMLLVGLFIFLRRRVSKAKDTSMPPLKLQILRVSYEELLKATNGFSVANLIGTGSYASVYKGIINRGEMIVAVKVLNLQLREASKSFISECKALRNIRHRNLLNVLSACSSVDFHGNEFKALVYEFMANGNLDKWLHQDGNVEEGGQQGQPRKLKLIQRLDICIDIGSALDYLHNGCKSTIIHGDVKPSNVLLDDDMTSHVGDFGLAKIISAGSSKVAQSHSNSTAIRGTIGYVAPEYGMGDMASTAGDVYSFGILLLEMFTGKRPTDAMFMDHLNIHSFVKYALPDGVMEVMDPYILLEHDLTSDRIKDCMVSVLRIGIACSMESPRDRMDIASVISELHKAKNTYTNERL